MLFVENFALNDAPPICKNHSSASIRKVVQRVVDNLHPYYFGAALVAPPVCNVTGIFYQTADEIPNSRPACNAAMSDPLG